MNNLLFLFLILIVILPSFSNATFDCTRPDSTTLAPIDPNFSLNACIIIKNFTAVDCSILPDPEPNITAINYCPGNSIIPTETIINISGTQVIFSSLEKALTDCPFNPVLIEFIGTLYVQNLTLNYPQNKNLIIRGYSEEYLIPGYNISELVLTNVTLINATTNETYIEEQLIPTITGVIPDSYATLQSTIVGFDDLNPQFQDISISLENFVAEGCYTDHGLFFTMACPADCGDDLTNYCDGNWYPKSRNVTDTGVCFGTGAMFNGTQRIAFQYGNTTNNCNINGFDTFSDGTQFRFMEEFTLELWINPIRDTFSAYTGIAGMYRNGDDNVDGGWGFYYQNNGFLRWFVARPNDRSVMCAQYITPNTWTHIAGVWKSGVLEFYINGALACNDTGPFTFPFYNNQEDRPFMLGAAYFDPNGGDACDNILGWQGVMDEVRLWSVARTSAQIQNAYSTTVPYDTAGLAVYMQFENNPSVFTNMALLASSYPPPQIFYESYTSPQPIAIVPDCLCIGTECTPTLGYYSDDPGAALYILSTENINDYEFINSAIINPNGPYGVLWIPGVYNTSGPLTNTTVRFWPGRFESTGSFELVEVLNTTTNITSYELIFVEDSNASTCFVPGAIPSSLPPLDSNQWDYLDFFVPGWFFNDGKPPYSNLNFIPGIFAPQPLSNTTDLVFTPGILYPNGTWSPFGPLDIHYIAAITLYGGATFNCDWVDECIIRNLTVVEVVPPAVSVIETEYGCVLGPNDVEPEYIDPLTRDPCYVLRDIKNALNSDIFPSDLAHACVVGEYDIEPTYLNLTYRDPCYILRDLHSLVMNISTFKCSNGKVPVPPIYAPCLKNQNLTINSMVIQNYYGEKVLCQWACDEYVTLVIIESNFTNIIGNAVWSSGLHHYDLHDNIFCPCGGTTPSCVYLNGNHISEGQYWIYNNMHCAYGDILPVTCDYDLTTEVSCLNGVLQCLDIGATLERSCQQVEIAPGVLRFDDDCAIYGPCECASQDQNITLPDGSFQVVQSNTGDIVLWVPYVSPLLYTILNGSDTLYIPCNINTTLQNFTYACTVDQNVTLVVGNVTINITIQVPANCSASLPVKVGTTNSLSCPCPRGFISGNVTSRNATGAAALAALGLYSTCEWNIPNGEPGEVCKDGIVQCPYLGGQLGTGLPPPAPIGVCNAGVAKLQCSDCNATGYIGYEGKVYACDPLCVTGNATVFEVACECTNFYLTVPCTRDVQCIPDTLCNATLNATLNITTYNPLCQITGILTYDGVPYPCLVLENQTLCVGISYAPLQPDPPSGFLNVPCDNSYITPSPGPCTCLNDILINATNVSLPANYTPCANSSDPNCTNPNPTPLYSPDPALQLICQADGTIKCRCDGFYAVNPFNGTNFTLLNTSAAFWIDHVNTEAEFFQGGNTAHGLPIGWRYTNFDYELIRKSAIKVLHFFSDVATMYESARLSQFITGTRWDWALGFDNQWNFRYCNSYDLGPDEGVFTNECKQYRPSENTSCVVDSTYNLEHTPFFGTLRFNRIADAMALDSCVNIIVHRAVNPYEERIISTKDNVWLGSYNEAVIISSGHQMRADYVTFRGLVLDHTNTNDFPLIQPTPITDQNFDTAFEGDPGKLPPVNCSILNCKLYGHNVNKAGVVIGQFGSYFRFLFNYVDGFYARAFWINSDFMDVRLNTFTRCPGRVVRSENIFSITFEENLFIDNPGLKGVRDLDIVLIKAAGSLGRVKKQTIGKIIFQNFTDEEYALAFDTAYAETTLDRKTMGCNADANPLYQCYFRGNVMKYSDDETTAESYDVIGYHLIGGNWTTDRIRDNVCPRARVGMAFYYCGIDYRHSDEIFYQNALIRTQDTYKREDFTAADFAYRPWGSLVSIGCYFPNCWPINITWPTMEVNPQHNLIVSEGYGLKTMNNITAASRWGRPLYMLNITSEKAILRKENIMLTRDIYAVGFKDPLCCKRPIVYGAGHTIFTSKTIFVYMEFRFYLTDPTPDSTGEKLWETTPNYLADDIRFYDTWFNGYNSIGSGRVRITNLFIDPQNGAFVLDRCKTYNWWHYPDGTTRGLYISSKGVVPVVVLPDGETVYYIERSPAITGFHVFFQKLDRTRRSIYGRNTKKNPFIDIDSIAIVTNNYFENLDGTALVISTPGNWDISRNQWIDCGMRQPGASTLISLEGNPDSVGLYFFEDNYINTSKPYLFPTAGGSGNIELFSTVYIFNMRFPTAFVLRNVTIALNGLNGTVGGEVVSVEEDLGDTSGSGIFSSSGPVILGKYYAPVQNKKKPAPNTWDASVIAKTNVDPKKIISGTNADPSLFMESDPDDYDDPIQKLTPLSGEYTYHIIDVNKKNISGYTIGLRLDLPHQVIVKTLSPGASNYSLSAFLQPQFIPYRIVSREVGSKTADILASGGTIIPTNGPGIQGIYADIVGACSPRKDRLQDSFSQCIICNDGCPVYPPSSCVVDAENATFVVENPYFNNWLFTKLETALANCKDPNRRIEVVAQTAPYTEAWNIIYGNYTIFSTTGASVLVSTSVSIAASDVSIEGITFIHNAGNYAPTLVSASTALYNIAFINCTFKGAHTQKQAVYGSFYSIAFLSNNFYEYKSKPAPIIDLLSSCGVLLFENNTITNAYYSALSAVKYDYLSMQSNRFLNCGSLAAAATPYCLYVSMCKNNSQHFVFSKNLQTMTNAPIPRTTYVAAYWLDNIDVFYGNTTAGYNGPDITFNAASNLDIGMRVTNIDDINTGFLSVSNRATVAYLTYQQKNIEVYGLWHDIVWGQPSGDSLIDSDPLSTEKYYCDHDCNNAVGYISLIIAIAAIVAFFVCYFTFRVFPLCRNLYNRRVVYSGVVGGYVALDPAYLGSKIAD